jgi:HK97 family phage prohead protease
MRLAGYAAVFDRPDNGGDIIRAGAFAESLAKARDVPLLWQHRPGMTIGKIEHLSEDTRGLRVIASLGGGETARKAEALVASRKLDGLSFGYRVRKAEAKDGLRELVELELVEISLVATPMQKLARVHAVE